MGPPTSNSLVGERACRQPLWPSETLMEGQAAGSFDPDNHQDVNRLYSELRGKMYWTDKIREILLSSDFFGDDPDILERTDQGYRKLQRLAEIIQQDLARVADSYRWLDAVKELIKTLYWEKEAGLDRFTITVPYNNHCITMSVVAKGDWRHANKVHFLIPGLAVDNRGFEPSLKQFYADPDAMVSVSMIGAGTLFPDPIDPTPEALTEIYALAIRQLTPSIDPKTGLVIAGNSMGGMIALGASLMLADDESNPIHADVVLDHSMTWDVLDGEMDAFLYQLVGYIHPQHWYSWTGLFNFGLSTTLNFDFAREEVVDILYGRDTHGLWERRSPRDSDLDYYRILFDDPPKPSGYSNTIDLLAKTIRSIDQWDEYFKRRFPSRV